MDPLVVLALIAEGKELLVPAEEDATDETVDFGPQGRSDALRGGTKPVAASPKASCPPGQVRKSTGGCEALRGFKRY